jgi:GNAT superfamily N-acetyltransferase
MPNLAEHSRGAEIDAQWARWLGVPALDPDGPRWQIVSPSGAPSGRVKLLRCPRVAVIRCPPGVAARLEPRQLPPPHAGSTDDVAEALGWSQARATPPEEVLYLDPAWLRLPPDAALARRLSVFDRRAFEALCAACTALEVERAELALDQPQPLGVFVDDSLASAASYLLPAGPIADVGILTHPAYRGHGLARAAAAASCVAALGRDLIPQWWSLVSNPASLAVGRSLGFRHYAFEEGLLLPAA